MIIKENIYVSGKDSMYLKNHILEKVYSYTKIKQHFVLKKARSKKGKWTEKVVKDKKT